MRQLTALDALFLAAENDRTLGHVSALGVYDPVTASGRPLDAALVRELVTERMHLLPPCGGDWQVCRSASTIRTGLTKALSTSTTTSATSRFRHRVTSASWPTRWLT